CPSIAKYRLAKREWRASGRTMSGSKLPAAIIDACTATAARCVRAGSDGSTNIVWPSVHGGSPGRCASTATARPAKAEASMPSACNRSASNPSPTGPLRIVIVARISLSPRAVGPLEQRTGIHPDLLAGDVPTVVAGEEHAEVGAVLGLDVRDRHCLEDREQGFGVLTCCLLALLGEVGLEHAVHPVVLQQVGVAVRRMDGVD